MSGFSAEHPGARVRPSPSFGLRRGVERPDAVVLHYTGMETGRAAEDRLCDPASEVSSHYLVHENGEVAQLVRESDRAWHAGRSFWAGADDMNSRSVGIEIVNSGHDFGYPDFPAVQVDAVIALLRGILRRHGIGRHRVLAHSDVSPGRKIDPGEKFPWARLAGEGVALHVPPAPLGRDCVLLWAPGGQGEEVSSFQRKLAEAGYGVEPTGIFDPATMTVTAAFQRRHRPARIDGLADRSTLHTLERLLDALAPFDTGLPAAV